MNRIDTSIDVNWDNLKSIYDGVMSMAREEKKHVNGKILLRAISITLTEGGDIISLGRILDLYDIIISNRSRGEEKTSIGEIYTDTSMVEVYAFYSEAFIEYLEFGAGVDTDLIYQDERIAISRIIDKVVKDNYDRQDFRAAYTDPIIKDRMIQHILELYEDYQENASDLP